MAWLLIQVATQVSPYLAIPNWVVRLVIVLLVIGFPVAVIFSWAFEWTPEGIQRSEDVADTPAARRSGRELTAIVTALAALAVGVFVVQRARFQWATEESQPGITAKAAAPAQIPEKSIAVLPFENFGEEKENAYFADGVQDDILTSLAKVADLTVISRRTVAHYRGSTEDIRQIGRALGVAHILEGSVRRAGGRILLTTQLIDARTGAEVWAEKFDRGLEDIFAIQSDIAQKIVGQLKASFSPVEKQAITAQATQDLEAYDLYLQARALLNTFGASPKVMDENRPKAKALLEKAIARDPQFVLAYCLLSVAQATPNWAEELTPDEIAQARATAEKAVSLAPESGDAHLALGNVYYGPLNDKKRGIEEV